MSTVVSHFFIVLGLLFFLNLAKGLSILFIFSKSQFFLQQLYLLIFGCAAHGRSLVGVPGPQRCGVGPMPRAQSEPGSPALAGRLPPPGPPGKLSPPVSKAWLKLTRLSGILSLQTSLWLTCSPFQLSVWSQSTRFTQTSYLARQRVLSLPNPLQATLSLSRHAQHTAHRAEAAAHFPPPLPSPCWLSFTSPGSLPTAAFQVSRTMDGKCYTLSKYLMSESMKLVSNSLWPSWHTCTRAW